MIVAPRRASRPQDYAQGRPERDHREFDPTCPFCPGNESETPGEVMRIPAGGTEWRVRVVPNKYPVLVTERMSGGGPSPEVRADEAAIDAGDTVASSTSRTRLLRARPAVGRHEVIIETPHHSRGLDELDEGDLMDVLRAYRARVGAAARDERVKHVIVFKNQGVIGGASIAHPHAQLAGLPLVPPQVQRAVDRSLAHLRTAGGSLLREMVEEEVEAGTRLLEATDHYAAYLPFAGANAYEIWVAPRSEPERFDRLGDERLLAFGRMVKDVLGRMRAALDDPDYNLILQLPPYTREGDESGLSWYAQILPRLTPIAGFEIGAGVRINPSRPEEAAERLRRTEAGPSVMAR